MSHIVRPATMNDLPGLVALLEHVDPGMITMPQTREEMEKRVQRSEHAFERPAQPPEGEAYFLILEDEGRIVGTSSIFTNLGSQRPFYSYRVIRESKSSPETGISVELDMLHLVNDHHGDAELGTLFILPERRGGGRGRLLSFARLMLIAAEPYRFGPRIMAEIRGWTDDDQVSPFWEAVGRKFFHMDYRVADAMSAKDHRFIADLMPRFPICADLLPEDARAVIAKAHDKARPARSLLESQGFRYNNVVDIFDAGPCVESFTDSIDIVRNAERMTAKDWVAGKAEAKGLLARADFKHFAATTFRPEDDRQSVIDRLGMSNTDEVMTYQFREPRTWRIQN